MTNVLINARPSPFGRKVAIAMLEKGIDFTVSYDVPWAEDTCTAQHNPLEQLPILITDNGETIYDSAYILTWLEARYPETPLLPADINDVLAAKKRQLLGERLMEAAQSLILERQRPQPSMAWVERQTRKVVGALCALDEMYADRQAPADDRPIDHGDIAVATTLLLFEFAVASGLSEAIDALVWRARLPSLTSFVEAIERRPSFVATGPAHMDVDLKAAMN
ncbi:glutathione S-transferase [Croceicoccus ponticola]|uniref:Glutathione S-transferase n=1 Tax=Croceicoccus ponticola TaxID=2217664 RepID=A0A437GUF4_9SPHN|nr:glutathione S-transferase N-terminal domain-containing protein [Croceicoccus ponticola]RVQ65022.1 glutathione S-transferase [Croceicoccus ponticola]